MNLIQDNPHFSCDLVVWNDEYSGRFDPPPNGYAQQFDLQWHLAMRNPGYGQAPGASTDEKYINDRVYEWTGTHPDGSDRFHDSSGGVRKLDHPLDPSLISGKRCIDIGCGLGRWTRVMQKLGAKEVLSVDMSPSAIEGTRKYNPQCLQTDIMRITEEHPDWIGAFDFANLWGVAMHTHDPRTAFFSAASTVKRGGSFYLMVYAPDSLHDRPLTNLQRKTFHALATVEERLKYVEHVWNREWDWNYPLRANIDHALANFTGQPKGAQVGVLDMLETFYNWVIPFDVIRNWMADAKFRRMIWLNELEPKELRCAYHVLGLEKDI
jgi:SAM-dependent methyltransferase